MCAHNYLVRLADSLKPATDLRQRATFIKHIEWELLWQMLPQDTQGLRFSALARNSKGFRVKLASIASRIQVLQQAMHMTDMARARWQNNRWEWHSDYITSSHKARVELFAWHVCAVHVS